MTGFDDVVCVGAAMLSAGFAAGVRVGDAVAAGRPTVVVLTTVGDDRTGLPAACGVVELVAAVAGASCGPAVHPATVITAAQATPTRHPGSRRLRGVRRTG